MALALALSACGGGGSEPAASGPAAPSPAQRAYATPGVRFLSETDVGRIIAQGVHEARARSLSGVIAVTDRSGNVLAVFATSGATPSVTIRSGAGRAAGADSDAQGLSVPRTLAAISKAMTGAYLSSAGNAFSTRTASMIVQDTFPPSSATAGLESGPLFGVQFSSLPCSDIVTRVAAVSVPGAGPRRTPLGLSADPGGFPLYKDGVLVGGVGAAFDDDYGFDGDVLDSDTDADEYVALAASSGFEAPSGIRADAISVDGTLLRYSDAAPQGLRSAPASAPSFASINGSAGALTIVRGYFTPSALAPLAGVVFGQEASGIRPAGTDFPDPDAYVLSDGGGTPRFPAIAGTEATGGAAPLNPSEVRTLMTEAFGVMKDARAQIRRPLGSRAEVTIAIVDTAGRPLGIVRSPDAPVFGIDVAVQKARSASFLSHPDAAADLSGALRSPLLAGVGQPDLRVRAYVGRMNAFHSPGLTLAGGTALSARAIGNLARPHFPDGQQSAGPGPLSAPAQEASPFFTGLQSSLIIDNLSEHVGHVLAAGAPDTAAACSFLPAAGAGRPRLANGLQIFPGGFPIYRGGNLVGAIGISGDGVDQDDMIGFLAIARAARIIGGASPPDHARAQIRADQLVIAGTRLRYVTCPFAPFLSSADQNVCNGL
jgi:uncharacterized protein GlcG (DUF336 family)